MDQIVIVFFVKILSVYLKYVNLKICHSFNETMFIESMTSKYDIKV